VEAMDQTPEAAVQIGSLVLLKHSSAGGKVKTFVRTLTQKELIFLEQNRELLQAPEDLIKRLSEVNDSGNGKQDVGADQ